MERRIETVLDALNREGVRYLVAGGVAVVLHGYLRTTADLDLIVQLDSANVLRALRALDSLGYRPRAPVAVEDFADAAIRASWMRDKNLQVFSLWSDVNPALEVDLFVDEPFDFETAYADAAVVDLDGTTAHVVPLPLLIEMKREVGRPRDLEDIAALVALSDEDED